MTENMTPELTLNPTETDVAMPELTLEPNAPAQVEEKKIEPQISRPLCKDTPQSPWRRLFI